MTLPDLTPRLVIGISGASGAAYGIRMLEILRPTPVETHLVISRAGRMTITQETDLAPSDVEEMADVVHRPQDIGATIASGSFRTIGMVVAPCSVKTMSEIAAGVSGSLLSRAADVVLKERRRLVLMVRETPLHRNHLRAMSELTELGAIIAPPVPAFYTHPASVEQMVDHTVGRVLDLFDIESGLVERWGGLTQSVAKS
jgi:4-hydroxy-3-polyprenylbenzoate decarboxylase